MILLTSGYVRYCLVSQDCNGEIEHGFAGIRYLLPRIESGWPFHPFCQQVAMGGDKRVFMRLKGLALHFAGLYPSALGLSPFMYTIIFIV